MRIAAYQLLSALGLLSGLAIAAVWISSKYRKDIDGARTRVGAGSRLISTPCGPIEYAETGSGPAILAIHGAGGGVDQGLALGGPLAGRGYRVIVMSRFGYLRTPAPERPSNALQADAHACLLDALGVSKTAVIGVSAGAPSALEFALRFPTRCSALVLLVPGWYPAPESNARRVGPVARLVFDRFLRSDFLFWAMSTYLPKLAARTVLGTPSGVIEASSPGEQTRVSSILRSISPISERQVGLSLEGQLTVERLSKPLESMTVPTLAISVEDDLYGTYANAQAIARRIPNCRFVGYATGGHLWVGHHDELVATVATFLQSAVY